MRRLTPKACLCSAALYAVDDRQGEATDLVVHGCLFEECYASKKGGGLHQGGGGKMSLLRSVFFNNSAGSVNIEDGEGFMSTETVGVDTEVGW